jgi:hypothetical protein
MDSPARSVWIGYDSREAAAFAVARHSVRRFDRYMPIHGVVLSQLRINDLYWRPTERRVNSEGRAQLWDVISGAWMATEHSLTRFLVPHLAQTGWALFVDGDVLVTRDIGELFALCDPGKAVMCVQHAHEPAEQVKMDGQVQTRYPRKNWSSVMAFNCGHPANRALTVPLINELPGRDLQRFCWLDDSEIGALPAEWNHLVGVTPRAADAPLPALIHFTSGLPDMPGYENQEYADYWRGLLPSAVGAW